MGYTFVITPDRETGDVIVRGNEILVGQRRLVFQLAGTDQTRDLPFPGLPARDRQVVPLWCQRCGWRGPSSEAGWSDGSQGFEWTGPECGGAECIRVIAPETADLAQAGTGNVPVECCWLVSPICAVALAPDPLDRQIQWLSGRI